MVLRKTLSILLTTAVTILIWQSVVMSTHLPGYILPRPVQVAHEFLETPWQFARATGRTVAEGLCGLGVALGLTTAVGLAFAISAFVERHVSAYLVSLQSIPVLAVAPLLTLWFGPGFWSKVAAAVLVCFFPLATAWSVGIRSITNEERDLFRTMGASGLQTVRWLVVPRTLPFFFGGLRVAAPLSILGAIVGEFVGATGGLGFLILSSSYYAQTANMFVCIILIGLISLSAYKIVLAVEKSVIFWQG